MQWGNDPWSLRGSRDTPPSVYHRRMTSHVCAHVYSKPPRGICTNLLPAIPGWDSPPYLPPPFLKKNFLWLFRSSTERKKLFFLFKKICIAFHLFLQTFCSCWNLSCLVYAEIFRLIHSGGQLGQFFPGLCCEWAGIIQIPGA